jgi:hypothetical protein
MQIMISGIGGIYSSFVFRQQVLSVRVVLFWPTLTNKAL